MFALLFAALLVPSLDAAETPKHTIIVDTDAGSDDLMAIAFLLARNDVRIEAITVSNGLAHVADGGRNILRLIELSGKRGIPVYLGRETPLEGNAEFPAEWRDVSDKLPGVKLPATKREVERESAADFLARRLTHSLRRARFLALGPLTNLAEVFRRDPAAMRAVEEIVIMGGAVRVPGNLGDGGFFKTDNKAAEWNLFVDPLAAEIVFASGVPLRLVPLDATNHVPIDVAFLEKFGHEARTPLARFVYQVLESDRKYIEGGYYCAWDPLAAAVMVAPSIVTMSALRLEIGRKPPEEGRTLEIEGPPNVRVAMEANGAAWKQIFLEALAR